MKLHTTYQQLSCHDKKCVPKSTGILRDENIHNDKPHFDNQFPITLSNVGLSIFEVLDLRFLQEQKHFEYMPLQFCYIWKVEHFPYRRPDVKVFSDFPICFNPIGNIPMNIDFVKNHLRYLQLLELVQLDLLVNFQEVNDLGETFCLGGFPWTGLAGTFIVHHYDDYYRLVINMIQLALDPQWLKVSLLHFI